MLNFPVISIHRFIMHVFMKIIHFRSRPNAWIMMVQQTRTARRRKKNRERSNGTFIHCPSITERPLSLPIMNDHRSICGALHVASQVVDTTKSNLFAGACATRRLLFRTRSSETASPAATCCRSVPVAVAAAAAAAATTTAAATPLFL